MTNHARTNEERRKIETQKKKTASAWMKNLAIEWLPMGIVYRCILYLKHQNTGDSYQSEKKESIEKKN